MTVVGAGILGLWQALTLAHAGSRVCVLEASGAPFTDAASRWAGAMLAPDCEAEIVDMGAGVRPAFPSNTPHIFAENNNVIRVNGAYRHGFLLAPVLACMVRDYLTTGARDPRMLMAT